MTVCVYLSHAPSELHPHTYMYVYVYIIDGYTRVVQKSRGCIPITNRCRFYAALLTEYKRSSRRCCRSPPLILYPFRAFSATAHRSPSPSIHVVYVCVCVYLYICIVLLRSTTLTMDALYVYTIDILHTCIALPHCVVFRILDNIYIHTPMPRTLGCVVRCTSCIIYFINLNENILPFKLPTCI